MAADGPAGSTAPERGVDTEWYPIRADVLVALAAVLALMLGPVAGTIVVAGGLMAFLVRRQSRTRLA